jgi:putative tricarboxylic transport membrane protein
MRIFTKDFTGGLAAICFASFYLYRAFQQRVSALADTIGPAGMPKVLGFLMLALGIILCLQALYRTFNTASQTNTAETNASEWQGEGKKILSAFGLLGLAIVYLLIVSFLGYALSIAILLAAVALYLGATLSWKLGVIALGGAGLLWAIFVILLGVPMPSGIFS